MYLRAGNAQKTAMSRAKNQAKADSSNKGAEPQARALLQALHATAFAVCEPCTRCLRHSAITPAVVPSTGSQLKQNAASLTLKVCQESCAHRHAPPLQGGATRLLFAAVTVRVR